MTGSSRTIGRLINVTFHGVGEPSRGLDAGEADVWLSSERFASHLDVLTDRPDVRICFDDGNVSDVEIALPELRRRGLRASFFVVAGRIGQPGFLDADAVRALDAEGMTIGCHGMCHQPWRKLDDIHLHEELLVARRCLEDVVGKPVTRAACPFGVYDRRVLGALRRYGYERVFTSDEGTARPSQWLQTRNTVRAGTPLRHVEDISRLAGHDAQAVKRQAKLMVKRWR